MNTCCICGKETGNDPQALIVNGEERQICDECAAVLDVAETADPASQGRIRLLSPEEAIYNFNSIIDSYVSSR